MTDPHEHEWERGAHMNALMGVDGRKSHCAVCGAPKPDAARAASVAPDLRAAADALDVALANYDDDPTDLATQGVIGTARVLRAALAAPSQPSRDALDVALPAGAYVASALAAAKIPCDSGEDVDRFLDELAKLGYGVARLTAAEETRDA